MHGETLVILGRFRFGKSTLLRTLVGLKGPVRVKSGSEGKTLRDFVA